jgi:hypothetical protein
MTSSTTTDGSYTVSSPVSATEEWRALFPSPRSEGLDGSSSAAVTVTVSGCVTRCPAAVVR